MTNLFAPPSATRPAAEKPEPRIRRRRVPEVWTQQETDVLLRLYLAGTTAREMSRILGRTECAIDNRLTKIGARGMRRTPA